MAHRLRDKVRDLDVVVRGETWDRVSQRGNLRKGIINGARVIEFCGGRIQFSQGWISEDYDADKLIKEAEVFRTDRAEVSQQRLRFARLDDVLRYKRTLRRSKDRSDIKALAKELDRRQTASEAAVDEAAARA